MSLVNQTSAHTFTLDGSIISLGRASENTIVIKTAGVSRYHAKIKLHPHHPEIIDSDSTFGVMVDGTTVTRAHLIHDAEITIGVMRFRVHREVGILSLVPVFDLEDATRLPLQESSGNKIVIGRDGNADFQLLHPLVSRIHATITVDESNILVIRDNHSVNGTYVNGKPISDSCKLQEEDIVQIGPFRFVARKSELIKVDDFERIKLEVQAVSVNRGGKEILKDISTVIKPGEFIVVLGPSGSGKSTLALSLCGLLPVHKGAIKVNGLDLQSFITSFPASIGYVAQENVLHKDLTVFETFYEQCQLRLPSLALPAEKENRIAEVLELLDLCEVSEYRINALSGGQVKRVHLGIELLSSPPLIILDEPLAGLDFGLIRSFMKLFRKISDNGHTILLTTHTIEQLSLVDRIFFVNKKKLLYQGNPEGIKRTFQIDDVADIYAVDSQHAVHQFEPDVEYGDQAKIVIPDMCTKHKHRGSMWAQFQVLWTRFAKILLRDQKNLALLLFQAPFIAFLLAIVYDPQTDYFPLSFYFCLSIASIWMGAINAIREIAREPVILLREFRAGLYLPVYCAAKMLVSSALAIVQVLLFMGFLTLLFKNFSITLSLGILIGAATVSGSVLGLTISAVSGKVNRAISWLPIMLIPQIFFSGILVPFDSMTAPGRWLSYATAARPVFSLFKRSCILNQDLWPANAWHLLFLQNILLLAGMYITLRLKMKPPAKHRKPCP